MKNLPVPETILGGLLLFLVGEILLRRWVFAQLPTPLGAAWVYALLAVDLAVLGWLGVRIRRAVAPSKRTDRS